MSIPITIITGFLGAGKTTMLNQLLKSHSDKKFAILQNEFGEGLGQHELKVNDVPFEWIELNNGCMCCRVKNDYLLAIESVIQMKNIDYIIIETSGLANPIPIITKLWTDEELKSPVSLDGIITLIDGLNFLKHLTTTNSLVLKQQIAVADKIIVNKTDLISDELFSTIINELKTINSHSPIEQTSYCSISSGLNLQAFNKDKIIHHLSSRDAHIDPKSNQVITLKFRNRPLKIDQLNYFMSVLLWEKNYNWQFYRIKGLIHIEHEKFKYSLQCVEELYILEPTTYEWYNDEFETKIIFIGQNLNFEKLSNVFEECMKINIFR